MAVTATIASCLIAIEVEYAPETGCYSLWQVTLFGGSLFVVRPAPLDCYEDIDRSMRSSVGAFCFEVHWAKPAFPALTWFRRVNVGGYDFTTIPLWLIALGMIVASAGARVLGARQIRRVGHCQTCGYDLRATPERCPECGTRVMPAVQ